MWILLVITLIDGGARPSKFEEFKHPTLSSCLTAQAKAERATPGTFAYCSIESTRRTR
jgi:hypothetical protein